jgi:hypothetical protein
MKLEIVLIDTYVELFRNSLDNDSLFLHCRKLGVWSTGKWGDEAGILIETEEFERDTKDESSADSFQDAVEGKIEEEESSIFEEQMFEGKVPPKIFKKVDTKHTEETYKIRMAGATISTKLKSTTPDFQFAKFDEHSLDLDVIFEDKTYVQPGGEWPMKLIINIPSLRFFAYEREFELLMKIAMENTAECPQTCVSQDLPDPYTDQTIWLIIDININNAILKAFLGERESIFTKFAKEYDTRFADDFTKKNPSSLAMLTLQYINFNMKMRKGGSKLMVLNVKNFDIYDIRYKTKLALAYRKIFNSNIATTFKFDDDTTTSIEGGTFSPENYDDFEDIPLEEMLKQVDLDNSVDEEEKKEKAVKPDHKSLELNEVVIEGEIPVKKEEEPKVEKRVTKELPKKKKKKAVYGLEQEEFKEELGLLDKVFEKLRLCCKRKKKEEAKHDEK